MKSERLSGIPLIVRTFVPTREILQRRIQIFEQALHLDTVRAVRWAFFQAVLSAIWSWEDGEPVHNANSAQLLAREIG